MEIDWKTEYEWQKNASKQEIKAEVSRCRQKLLGLGVSKERLDKFEQFLRSYIQRVIKRELAVYTGTHEEGNE